LPSQRIIYNDKNLRKYKEKEIKILKRNMKEMKLKQRHRMKLINTKIKSFTKRDLKKSFALKIIINFKGKRRANSRKKNSKEGRQKIEKISKMTIFKYLRHINGDEDKENEIDSSKIDEIENKIYNLEELIDESKEIKYRII